MSFFNKRYIKGVLFSAKMVNERVRGWTSGRSIPVLNFVKYPPGGGFDQFASEHDMLE